MECPLCQAQNRDGARFCRACGTPLGIVCPSCGAKAELGSKFCDNCGGALGLASPPLSPRFVTPEDYTPKHLAEKILTSRKAIEGERKQVTVLFADLKDSMQLLTDRDPEDARKILDPVLEYMIEAVHRYEGLVNQVLGDGIMALFGAPIALEDHALRACYSALAMQSAIGRYADEMRRSLGTDLLIRVGLNSGDVVVRAISNDLHIDYSAVGLTTHLAARMEQLAPPASILLTAQTMELVEGYVDVVPLGVVPVRGAGRLPVFRLLGASRGRTRLQVAAARGLTPFVGRNGEIEALTRALQAAAAGQGQIVALLGDPGVGKSRLVWELTQSDRTAGWRVLESSSVSYGKATAYAPVRDLLRRLFNLEERDDPVAIREKVMSKVLSLARLLEDTVPAVLALLEALPDDNPFLTLDPSERRQRLLEAIKRLLVSESRLQPLLVVVEDLHWIDSESQAVLDGLVDSIPAARILLLVSYRREYQHRWGSKTYYTQIQIDPLSPETAEALLQALIGSGPDLRPLKQLLIDRTERNPLFLEESVRTLIETQILVGERGAYRLATTPDSIQIPATVRAVLAARIDRLTEERKALLQTASVIGKHVPLSLLEAIVDMPPGEFRSGLAYLQTAEFLYEASLFPEIEYTFKHALTHEVTYGSLLQERRRALHGRIVEAMERLYADRVGEQVERLAHHAFRGQIWGKAVGYLRQAGTKNAGHSAYREAIAYFEQALVGLQHLPERREMLEQAIDVRFDLRNALFALGEIDRIVDYLNQAAAVADKLGDQRRLGWVSAFMTHYFWRIGDHPRAIESGLHTLSIAESLQDVALQTTNVNLGLAYYAVGDYPRAIECLQETIRALTGDRLLERFNWAGVPAVIARAYMVGCLTELGRFSEGVILGEEGIRIAEAANHAFSLGQASVNLGVLYLRKGDLAQACSVLERGRELTAASNVSALSAGISAGLGYAYAFSGRFGEATLLLERAVEHAATKRIMARHSLWLAWLSEAYLFAGRHDEATELARRALALSVEHKERGNQAYILRLLGEIASQSGYSEHGDADELYRRAASLASELGMRPLLGYCHLGLGRRYRQIGRIEQARHELSIAVRLFRSMEMTAWLRHAEHELPPATAS